MFKAKECRHFRKAKMKRGKPIYADFARENAYLIGAVLLSRPGRILPNQENFYCWKNIRIAFLMKSKCT